MPRWSGEKDSGAREYTPKEAQAVTDYFKTRLACKADAQNMDEIAAGVSLRGRTLRAIISDIDGRELVVAQDEGLVWMAQFEDEAETATRQLFSRARRIRERAERRNLLASTLPRLQGRIV